MRKGLRWILNLARLLLIAYLLVVLFLDLFQDSLVFPGSWNQGRPDAQVHPSEGSELIRLLTDRGEQTVALFASALSEEGQTRPDSASCPTLLFFHGNGNSLARAQRLLELFRRKGMNVMIPEYIGYGLAEGSPSELGCRYTAKAALAHLKKRSDVDPSKIIIAGTSLGGAVAIDLASTTQPAGLAAFSTFTSLADVVRFHYPWVPTSVLLRHKFDSRWKIGRLDCPVFLAHGLNDPVVPDEMTDQLAKDAIGRTEIQKIERAGHNLFQNGEGELMVQLSRFVNSCTSKLPASAVGTR